jgi:hypothetical protein
MSLSAAASSTEAAPIRTPIPLRDRRYDWFFIVVFTVFIGSSFTGDIVNMVSRPDPNSDFFLARFVYHVYAEGTDPLLIANPRFLQVGASVSAVVFGTFYVLLVYAFVRGREWIRRPSFIYTGMVVQTTFIVVMVGFAGDAKLFQAVCNTAYDYTFTNVPKALAYNLPYIIVPILLTARMWRSHPFTRIATQN